MRRRVRAAFPVTLVVVMLGGLLPGSVAGHEPAGLDRFLYALAQAESGGRYDARNPTSGAYGKYQIMPSSWRDWAARYLGNANAPQTAANQETVARAKVIDLYHWLGKWPLVAYWWLTGTRKSPDVWSAFATRYVTKIMAVYAQAVEVVAQAPRSRASTLQETSGRIAYNGRWAGAKHGGYSGGAVRYSGRAGATATVTFSGTRITWYGPVGPTRGRAQISIDGTAVRTINLSAPSFTARRALFTKRWASAGSHTMTIEVLASRNRIVAIDSFSVWP
jgi:hypothetical protein